MKRLIAIVVAGAGFFAVNLAAAQEQPVQPQPPAPQPALIEAKKHVVVTWTLADVEWDFKDVLSSYEPVAGLLDAPNNLATWTFEFPRDLLEGEVLLHKEKEGPFKVVMLDADKVPLSAGMQVAFSEISGKKGDRVRALFVLPPAEVFIKAKHVRIERRTKVGFETPQPVQP